MRLAFQILLAVLIGFGSIYAGIVNFYSPSHLYSSFYQIDLGLLNNQVLVAIETQTRLMAGMWISSGIMLLACIRNFESNRNIIWLVFLGLSIGAIGELISTINLNGNIQAASIKAFVSIGLCLAMEVGRIYVNKSSVAKSNS